MRVLRAVVCGLAAWTAPRAGQPASIVVEVSVSTTALSVAQNTELTFGAVPVGVATTVDPQASVNAGEFEIHGNRNAEISITMTLPDSLRVGANAMPISFGANGGCHRNRIQQAQCDYFDPTTPLVVRIRNTPTPNNTYIVWMGGTVTPSPTQQPGIYRGTITLTTAYTGN